MINTWPSYLKRLVFLSRLPRISQSHLRASSLIFKFPNAMNLWWRSFPLFSRPSCLIQGWYCLEKYNASHFYRWKDGKATITAKAYSVSKFASLKRTSILFSAFFPFLSRNLVRSRTAPPHFFFLCCPISLNVENTYKSTNNNKTHRRRIEGLSYVTNLKMDNSLKWVLFNIESGQITSDAL